jgi:hypothetical protein
MDKAQRTQKWAYDQHHAQDQGFKVGDEVWLDAWDLSTDWPSPKLDVLCQNLDFLVNTSSSMPAACNRIFTLVAKFLALQAICQCPQ